MAKVKMKYAEVAVSSADSGRLFDKLQMSSVFEFRKQEEIDGLESFATDRTLSQLSKYSDTAETALKVLDRVSPEKKGLIASLKPLPEMSVSDYIKKSDEADRILSVCFDICECDRIITQSKADIARNEAARDAVRPWLSLDIPMQYKGTQDTAVFIGTMPDDYTAESLSNAVIQHSDGAEDFECEIVSHEEGRSCVVVICHKECEEKVFAALRNLGFAYPADPTKHPPEVRYSRLAEENKKLKKAIEESEDKIISLSPSRRDIEFLCDYFSIKKGRYEALGNAVAGDTTVIISGYVPADRVSDFESAVGEFAAAYTVTDPAPDDDNVPTLLRNKPIISAVEPITDMYSPPGKGDVDPNPIMAAFYYLLFGIMLSDAGYGLLMAIGCGIAKFKFKPSGKLKKTVDMYFWCGLATLFWGTLFGSWFGDIFEVVSSQFFGIADLGAHLNTLLGFNLFKEGLAVWFQPVNDPMKLMLYSFLFGIIHLFVGLGASFVKMWKNGNKTGAIFDVIPVYLLVLGIAPIGASILIDVPGPVKSIGKWLALAGTVLIVLTAGRDSKNIVGKLGLGLYGLYNTASGWLSDILSYSRLLALGLCTGVIASVVNTLGTIPSNLTVKAIMLVPVFIFGHTVNMAINLIGTYVHTNRLQYVEFFSKFYEGGGRSFTPLKADTKYFQIKEDK